jgi:hypothetical protein
MVEVEWCVLMLDSMVRTMGTCKHITYMYLVMISAAGSMDEMGATDV